MWKQRVTKFPGDWSIQDRFADLMIATNASADFALFSRTSEDFESEIFLLSPAAAVWADRLGGEWVDAPDALEHKWKVAAASTNTEEHFGIKLGFE